MGSIPNSRGLFPNESEGGFYQLVSHEELEEAEQLFGVKLNYHHDTMEPWPLLAPVLMDGEGSVFFWFKGTPPVPK